jgi:predicted ATPase/DNA-binding SARP family transcriptional activator
MSEGVADRPHTLAVLGEPRAWTADGAEGLARRRKELVLLAYLAGSRRPVSRERLAALLWGDRPDERARHSLRQALHRIGGALPGALEAGPDHVAIAPGRLATDAAAFEADVTAGRWEDAVARWRGEPLAGCDDAGGNELQAWLTAERACLGRLHAAALQRLTESARDEGRWGDAAAWAARWSESAPHDESAAASWIRSLRLSGRPEDAAARHAEISARWADLDVEPSPEWRALGDTLARETRSRPTAGLADTALRDPDLIGRAKHFSTLLSAWERVRDGSAAAIVVEGEPGLGKSRLLDDVAARARSEGGAWIGAARGSDAREAGDFAVMRDALGGLEAAPGLVGAPDWALAEAARLVPALRERFRALPPPGHDEAILHEALCRVLTDVAAEIPILLLVDDAGGADPASARLLAALARRRIPGLMLLLAAYPAALDLPTAERLSLDPLSPAETEALVAGMLELPLDDRRRLADWVQRESGGTPFYAVELVRALADEERLRETADGRWRLDSLPTAGSLPARVQDAIARKLARVSPDARRLLSAAARAGHGHARALAAAAGLEERAAADALDELLVRRLLREGPHGYEPAHPLLRRHLLDAAPAPETSPPPLPAAVPPGGVFVAREREMERLEAALARAVSGEGAVAWVAGEPGIGKTALLREFVRRAAEREPALRVGWGECDALAGQGSAYLPFREIWRGLGEILPDPAGFDAPRAEGVAEWFTAEVRRGASGSPLVLVIDDLQWADAPSLGLLFHLARRISDARILLVAAYRDAEVAVAGEGRSTSTLIAEWMRLHGGGGIALEALDAPDALRLAAEVLESGPDELSPGLRERLLRHTGGHPLFTVEAVRELRDRGGIVRGDGGDWREGAAAAWAALPARVEGVIAERVRRLPPELRRLLEIASVEGQVFTAEVVAEVAGFDAREVVQRLGGLDREHRLVALHGVRQLPGGRASRYRFRHALFQAHVYGLLDAAERRYLHGDVGGALERLYGHHWTEASPRLARHFTEAEDDERAARHLHAAGTRAALASAYDEAGALFARALDAAERSGQHELAAAIRESAADALHLAGDQAVARAGYERLLASIAAEGDGAGTRARLLRKLGDAWQAERALEPAFAVYARARDALFEAPEWRGDDFAEWARLEVGWARALLAAGRLGELQAFVREAAAGVERYGAPGQRTATLTALLRELSRREQFLGLDAMVAAFRTHAAQALKEGKPREQAGAEFAVGFTQLWRGRLDDAAAPLESALALAEAQGERWREAACCASLALLHRRRGDIEAVHRWTARGEALQGHLPVADGLSQANAAWLAWRVDDANGARRHADAALRTWAGISPAYPFEWAARWPLLAITLAEGAIDQAVEHARAQLDPEQHPLPDDVARELALAVDLWEGGDSARASLHLQRAAEMAVPLGFL